MKGGKKMSDSQEKLGVAADFGKNKKNRNTGKMKFNPPVLHKFGEAVKLCRAAPTQGQNDYYTS